MSPGYFLKIYLLIEMYNQLEKDFFHNQIMSHFFRQNQLYFFLRGDVEMDSEYR